MSRDAELVVIGAGIAGRFAALAAAEAGISVRLLSDSEDGARFDTGLLELLGRTNSTAVVDPFDAFGHLDDRHPYRIAGLESVRNALRFAERVLGDRYRGFGEDRNALVISQQGALVPVFAYPRSVASGLASDSGTVHLVDLSFLPDVDARVAAASIRRYDPHFEVTTNRIGNDPPKAVPSDRLGLAARLDEEIDDSPSGREVLPWLVDRIGAEDPRGDRIGLPAFLGRERTDAVLAHLESRLGIPVFEIPTAPPSLTGIRLDDRLDQAIRESSVEATTATPVVDYRTAGDRIEAVGVERAHTREWIAGERFVLATGGLLGGGITEREGEIVESVFDCPVEPPAERGEWTAADPYDTQPFATFGVDVDDEFRPRAGGEPCFTNLWATGRVIGGFDPIAQRAGFGTSLVTGHAVGRRIGTGGRHV
ncbi:MAG: anaerobic glycerol-3-phosphate dehydrogenase subunit B [Halanaeroarchaeum sp.]